jgi:uncharacterized protein YdaU (DUF1376 family)
MSKDFPWFPCESDKLLNGIGGLPTSDQKLVYQVVLLRIYDLMGPCPDGVEIIATRCAMNKRRAADALNAIFLAGKFVRVEGGIHNPKAMEVIERMIASRAGHARAGAEGGKRTAEKLKGNQTLNGSQAPATAKHSKRVEVEEDSLFPDGNRTPVASQAPVYADSKHELWGEGTAILVQLGTKEKLARQMIGLWLRDTGDDAATVLAAIQRARDHRVNGPIPWVTRALQTGRSGNGRRDEQSTVASAGRLVEAIRGGEATLSERPSILRAAGENDVRLLSPGRRE